MYVAVPVLIKMQYERMRHALLLIQQCVKKTGVPDAGML